MTPVFFESQFKMPVMKLDLRSTVVPTSKGSVIISPLDFTEDQFRQIEDLGPVAAIVAPSLLHNTFVNKASRRFPKATVWGVPGLKEKCPDIQFDKIIGNETWPYQAELETKLLQGAPRLNEAVFFHPESRTLVLTDLCFNLRHPQGLGAWLILKMMGTYKKFAISRLVVKSIQDKNAFKASAREMMKWDFDQIVVAHGELVRSGGKRLLQDELQKKIGLN
ncbi:MAG: DUF4336 domain-containing protein [Bdellovibrionaceae bacterium]|nr:DUF4336 domain-containing protein [Pseudobdellovibrionaceae bacterium]